MEPELRRDSQKDQGSKDSNQAATTSVSSQQIEKKTEKKVSEVQEGRSDKQENPREEYVKEENLGTDSTIDPPTESKEVNSQRESCVMNAKEPQDLKESDNSSKCTPQTFGRYGPRRVAPAAGCYRFW